MRLDSPVDVVVMPVCHPQGRAIIVKGLGKKIVISLSDMELSRSYATL